jgi:hypothetical protein
MDSSLDESMKEQVLTMTTSARAASGMTVMPAAWRWPTMISESTRFFAHPRESRLTVITAGKVGGRGRRPRLGTGGAVYFDLAPDAASLALAARRLR